MNKELAEIVNLLPYKKPFLFVDSLDHVDDQGATGRYELKKDEYFYQGHFPDAPITPGVIIIEIMAQIGLVCFGIHLGKSQFNKHKEVVPIFSSSNVDFLSPAYPGDKLKVNSEKIYYRFNKLKCKITCKNLTTNDVVCSGEFSGMIVNKQRIGK
jgi:3-hydroxyacyl-[acyl-carrier-protein] dehydratase